MRYIRTFCCFVLYFSSAAIAQEKGPQFFRVELTNCVTLSAVPKNEDFISVSLPQTKNRTATREVSVQRFRQEARTRTVTANGVPQQQTYTVSVPYTEVVSQSFSISVPDKPKIVTIPLNEIDAWDRNGALLDSDRLRSRLSGTIPAIMLKQEWPKQTAIQPAQLAVLRDDIVFVYAEKLRMPHHPKQIQ